MQLHRQSPSSNSLMRQLATITFLLLCLKVHYNSSQLINRFFNRLMSPLRESIIDPLMGSSSEDIHPDAFRNFTQLAESRGFQAEVHKVVTADGYILTVHRLINPLVTNEERRLLRPVIVMHGLMCSSDDFIINSRDSVAPERPNLFDHNQAQSQPLPLDQTTTSLFSMGDSDGQQMQQVQHSQPHQQGQQVTKTSQSNIRLARQRSLAATNRRQKRQKRQVNNNSFGQHSQVVRQSEFIIDNNSNNKNNSDTVGEWPHELVNTGGGNKTPNALAYTLVNNGYDVWLPNIRGNTYSKEHVSMTSNDRLYWDFSLDELVQYDLPAIIAYVQKQTGKLKLAYVGHSQATATMFALLASKPNMYTNIIEPFVALAPIAYLQHISTPVRHLVHLRPITKYFTAPVPAGPNLAQRLLMPLMCMGSTQSELCSNTVFLAAGFDESQYDQDRIPVYTRHVPAGTSWKILNHYGQMYSSGVFSMYDYGQSGNQAKYKSASPPNYNVSLIRSKAISLLSCSDDWFGPPEDLIRLKRELTVPIFYDYNINDPTWRHLDFMYGKHAGSVINTRVLKILNHFSTSVNNKR